MNSFIIKDIRLITTWYYNLLSNTDCTICRCSLNSNSLYNQDKGIDSQIIQGLCGHTFHEECILPWLIKNKHCPICSSLWIEAKKLKIN
jgi:RING-box protein 1